MKAKKLLIISLFNIMLSNASYAQFNTIGRTESAMTKKKDRPSEPITQQDSLPSIDTIKAKGKDYSQVPVALPLKYIFISSHFGMRQHPIFHKKMMHNGIDLQARYEDVYSMFPGRVTKVGSDHRSGRYVIIQTGDYTISYCHLSKSYVHEGDFVEEGKSIAQSGNTGNSTGPHLHLTTKKDGKVFNPVILFNLFQKSCIKP